MITLRYQSFRQVLNFVRNKRLTARNNRMGGRVFFYLVKNLGEAELPTRRFPRGIWGIAPDAAEIAS
jgi:hypothetical protein